MLIATVIFLPIVLAYTAWVYKVLWGKVSGTTIQSAATLAQLPPAGEEACGRDPIQPEVQHLMAHPGLEAVALRCEAEHYLPLIARIIDQTERRVFAGEAVPADDKLVSLFETHTDIIVKGSRDVHYGHKLNLATGRSGLILDLVIEAGNPADSARFLPMLERHVAHHDAPPRHTSADGGYASTVNLERAKVLGVEDVAFHKKCRLAIEDMVKNR